MTLLFTFLLFPFGFYAAAATDLDNACRIAATQTWYWPFSTTQSPDSVYKKITSSYGFRAESFNRIHYGVDIGVTKNTPVYPIRTGTVSYIHNSNSGAEGRYVIIQHDNGFCSKYLHLQEIKVKVNDPVSLSTVIALSGGSGNGSDSGYAYHLHLAICYGSPSSSGTINNSLSINPCPAGYTSKGSSFIDGYPMENATDTNGNKFSTSNPRVSYVTMDRSCSHQYETVWGSNGQYEATRCKKCTTTYNFDSTFSSESVGTYRVTSEYNLNFEPYADAKSGKVYSKGTEFTAVGHVINAYGNKWYKTNDGYFVYSAWAERVGDANYLTLSGETRPSGDLPKNKNFGLRGIITSCPNLTNVTAQIINTQTNSVVSGFNYTKSLNAASYNIQSDGLNDAFVFGKLPIGNYRYVVKATNSLVGTKTLIDSYFTIGGGGSAPATYTISYNANGGTGAPGNQTKTQGTALTLSSTVPTRTGYTFIGWSTSSGGSVQYQPGGSYTTDAGVTLYAVWEINYYIFDLNGYLDGIALSGIGGFGTCDVYMNGACVAEGVDDYCTDWPYGTSYEIKNIRATTGHEYNGVYSGALSGTIGAERTEVYLSFSTCYYDLDLNGLLNGVEAWDINNYGVMDVYINGNLVLGGCSDFSDYVGNGKWPYGTTYEIRNIRPAEGYSYDGISNIAYDEYIAGDQSGTITGNTSVRLAFHTSPTSLNESPEPAVFGGHTYYYFSTPVTWYDAKTLCENMGGHLVSVTSEEETNFLVNLVNDHYKEESGCYIWLGATDRDSEGNWKWITGENISYTKWFPDEPNNSIWNEEGAENYAQFYTWQGDWNDTSGCSKMPFVCEIDSASYTLNFDANGGTGTMASLTPQYKEPVTIPNCSFEKSGYTFTCWNLRRDSDAYWYVYDYGFLSESEITEKGLSKTAYLPDTTMWIGGYDGSKSYTFVAMWKANTYAVSYDANGGTGAPASQAKTHDTALTLSGTKPTRANASAGSYTVTLNPNGGSVDKTSLSAARTTSYTFKNWNTAANGSGTDYNPGARYTANAAAALYAQWNSSTTTAAVTLPTPTRSGYSFLGWATSSSAAGGVTGSYTPSGNVTLYAIWQKQNPDFVLPSALREVEEEAFAGAAFSYVHVPEQVTRIGKRAFADCPNLRNIDIPAGTTAIDATAFEGVSELTIHGAEGSYAEFYAGKHGFDFVAD